MFIYENDLNVTPLPKSTTFVYFEYFLFRFLLSTAYLIFFESQSGKYLNICLSYNFYCERDVVKMSKLQLLNQGHNGETEPPTHNPRTSESIFLSRVEGRGFQVEGEGSMSRVEGNLFFFQIFFFLEKVTIDALKK